MSEVAKQSSEVSLNKVILIGSLTREPEVRETSEHKKFVVLQVLTTETKGNGTIRCTKHLVKVFGKKADIVATYRPGDVVKIEGKLCTDEWRDHTSGRDRKSTYVDGVDVIRF